MGSLLAKQGCDTLEAERTLMLAALEVEHD